MQTLYGIHKNVAGQISVDVFSPKHLGASKWRIYFALSHSSVARLRRIYKASPRAFYISNEWSSGRWRAYKVWAQDNPKPDQLVGPASLDSIQTKGQA